MKHAVVPHQVYASTICCNGLWEWKLWWSGGVEWDNVRAKFNAQRSSG